MCDATNSARLGPEAAKLGLAVRTNRNDVFRSFIQLDPTKRKLAMSNSLDSDLAQRRDSLSRLAHGTNERVGEVEWDREEPPDKPQPGGLRPALRDTRGFGRGECLESNRGRWAAGGWQEIPARLRGWRTICH